MVFSPKLMTLSITQGVQEGTTLIATIIGAGINDNIRLHRESANANVCIVSGVISYGVF